MLRKAGPKLDEWEIDVIVLPGVGTYQYANWRAPSGPWLEDLIQAVEPDVQVWAFEYAPNDLKTTVLEQLLHEGHVFLGCLENLVAKNDEVKKRPILFVCHSLGGIVLKKALCVARDGYFRYSNIIDLISGIIFLATPHIAADDIPDRNVVDLILRSFQKVPQKNAVSDEDNTTLRELSQQFELMDLQVPILSVYEGKESKIQESKFARFRKPRLVKIIPRRMSKLNAKYEELCEADANHNDICCISHPGTIFNKARGIFNSVIENGLKNVAEKLQSYQVPLGLRNTTLKSVTTFDDTSKSEVPASGAISTHGLRVPSPPTGQATHGSTAGSFEIVPSEVSFEPPPRKVHLPCFSVEPHEQNPRFCGRKNVLALIDDSLLPIDNSDSVEPRPLRSFALCGMGGIGKTQAAVEYVFTRRSKFDAIFWLHADEKTILAENFASIAIKLGLEEASEAKNLAASCALVQGWLSNPVRAIETLDLPTEDISWLLVFDNADELKVLEDFWPLNGQGAVLVTSRDPDAKSSHHATFYSPNQGVDLLPMTPEASNALMQSLTHGPADARDKSLDTIVRNLGGLPLAITQMAGIMIDLRMSYSEFLNFSQRVEVDKLHMTVGDNFGHGYKWSLATVWALNRLSVETRALLQVISLLDPDQIHEQILTEGGAVVTMNEYPRNLGGYYKARAQLLKSSLVSLVKLSEDETALSVHRVVQDATRADMNVTQVPTIFHAAVTLISKIWPFQSLLTRHYVARLKRCAELFPNVVRLKNAFNEECQRRRDFKPHVSFAALLNDAGWYLFERGFAQESKAYYQLAQVICENSDSQDLEQVSYILRESHNNQGSAAAETNDRKGCLHHSLIWLQMSLDRKSDSGDPIEDYELGITYNETGVACGMNDMYEEAADYFIKSMNIMRQLDNFDDTMLGWPETNLGFIYWVQGKLDDAELVLNEILEIHAAAFGLDDTESFKTGKILHALGNLYTSQGRMEESFDFHKRAYAQYTITLGNAHPRTADVCCRLTEHYIRLGDLNEAEKMITQALNIFTTSPFHKPEASRATFKKAKLLQEQKKTKEAAATRAEAIDLRRAIVPEDIRSPHELNDDDFDKMIIFWSR